jgi:hypothetical protein
MTTWASLSSNEILTRQDLEDNINNGTFSRKSSFDISGANANKTVTKNDIDSFIYFTPNSSYYAKSGLTEIAKQDISAGGGSSVPNRYFLTQYVACSATSTTTTANLGGGVSSPSVGNFVSLSGTGGCWYVSSIDQSTSVSYTINGNYGTDCACGYVVPNRYFLTRYSSCSPTSDTTTANLTTGLTTPAVNSFVSINGLSGCWKITSIDQNTAVSYTITNVYGTDCACSQPSISSTSSFTTFSTCLNVPSASQTMTVSGVNLTNSIVVTGDALLQFSLTNNNDFASSVSVAPASGTVPSTTVYVRLTGGYVNSTGLSISITSTGASSISKTTGTAYTFATPTVTGTTDGSRSGTGTVALSATVSASCTADWYAQSSGGTALATGTLSFTTPSISQTTVYYVQARDISGNNCVNNSRSAVTATINAVTNPAPINSDIVFWGKITTDGSGFPVYYNNGINSPTNDATFVLNSSSPTNSGTLNLDYFYLNEFSGGRYINWAAGSYLANAPTDNNSLSTSCTYTLMAYCVLPTDGVLHKLWCKDSNTNGWDTIWEPTTNRFTFRTQDSYVGNFHISYTATSGQMNLYTFVMTTNHASGTLIQIYVNGSFLNSVVANNGAFPFDELQWAKSSASLKFGWGSSGDATYFNGKIKHLLMYRVALNSTQISDIYNYLSTH